MAKTQAKSKKIQSKNAGQQLHHAVSALKQIANTLGFLALRQGGLSEKSVNEKIILLDSLGFDRNSIAAIVGTTPNTVSVRLSEAKSQQSRKSSTGD